MSLALIIFSLCFVAGAYSSPTWDIGNVVANGVEATNAPHSCIVLVRRPALPETQAALGGCSIISDRHCVTSASLIQGYTAIEIAFFAFGNRRRVNATLGLPHSDYDRVSRINDIALVIFAANSFPSANVIAISEDEAEPAAAALGAIAGFGFQGPNLNTPSNKPYLSPQTVSAACTGVEVAETHFCAVDVTATDPTIICPGDNGAGLFIEAAVEGESSVLVGITSIISGGCESAVDTAFTRVSLYANWINSIVG